MKGGIITKEETSNTIKNPNRDLEEWTDKGPFFTSGLCRRICGGAVAGGARF